MAKRILCSYLSWTDYRKLPSLGPRQLLAIKKIITTFKMDKNAVYQNKGFPRCKVIHLWQAKIRRDHELRLFTNAEPPSGKNRPTIRHSYINELPF